MATTVSTLTAAPYPVLLPGLDPDRNCRVRDRTPPGNQFQHADIGPRWPEAGLVLTGRVLAGAGIRLPVLPPEHAVVVHAQAPRGTEDVGRSAF